MPKKKKIKDIFSKDKGVKQVKKALNALERERKSTRQDLDLLSKQYEKKMNSLSEGFMDGLPLETLSEVTSYAAGTLKKEFSLQFFQTKAEMEQQRAQKINELIKLNKQLNEEQINLLLSKVDCVLKILEEK